jgi:hypothetical protein
MKGVYNMDNIKVALRLIRKQGTYIPMRIEKYIYEELEDDLFPYAYGDGSIEAVMSDIYDLLDEMESGRIDLRGTYEDRLVRRYESLKSEHLDLLSEMNQMYHDSPKYALPNNLPF